jgi:hypothetical protein
MNDSSKESKFKVFINSPPEMLKDKLFDLLKLLEVKYDIGNKKDFDTTGI